MGMINWARHEVELAKQSADYNEALCYDSALRAYESLCVDGHSDASIQFTKDILNKLINCEPLTQIGITDEFVDPFLSGNHAAQCTRMPSLFRYTNSDGSFTYSDINRVICEDINTHERYIDGRAIEYVDQLYPVKLPYTPPARPYKLQVERTGNAIRYYALIRPNGDIEYISKCFEETKNGLEPITMLEYLTLRKEQNSHET